MEKIKFILFFIVILILVGAVGYWAISSIQSGTEHVTAEKISQLEEENEKLKEEVENLTDELKTFKPTETESEEQTEEKALTEEKVETEPTTKTPEKVSSYKNQNLINELQELIDDNIYMKLKSSGTRVGTVQKFLNIYNKTSNRIDNDYGATTQKAVATFQKKQGLKADGEAGADTFNKMIDWLKKQG